MNRKILTTAAWLLIATATFVLGWNLKPNPEASNPSANEQRLIGRSSLSLVSEDPNELSTDSDADAEAQAAAQFATLQTRRILSSAQIEELGATFKTTLDPIERRLTFAALLESLTVDNAREIRKQIEHLPSDSSEFREFHFAWGKIGGVDAIMNGAGTDQPDMAATLSGWASADPQAAMKWLENLDMANDPRFDILLNDRGIPSEKLQAHLLEGMVYGLATTDPDLASKFIFDLAATGNERAEGMLAMVAGNVLRSKGPVEAAKWAENLPEGALRSNAMGRIANEYARKDPAAAAAWATAYVYDEKGGNLIHGVTDQWARRDGEAAVAWLQSLGETPGVSGAYRDAFEGWARQNPTAASEYLTTMPVSPSRDSAIAGLVNRSRWEDPVSAIVWADTITSEKVRLETLARAGEAWAHQDYAAAVEWATTSGLPEKIQQSIIHSSGGGQKKDGKDKKDKK